MPLRKASPGGVVNIKSSAASAMPIFKIEPCCLANECISNPPAHWTEPVFDDLVRVFSTVVHRCVLSSGHVLQEPELLVEPRVIDPHPHLKLFCVPTRGLDLFHGESEREGAQERSWAELARLHRAFMALQGSAEVSKAVMTYAEVLPAVRAQARVRAVFEHPIEEAHGGARALITDELKRNVDRGPVVEHDPLSGSSQL